MKKKIVLALLLLSLGTALAANTSFAQEISPPKVSRISGKDRRDTAIEISKYIEDKETVIVARDDHYADALSGSSLEGNPAIFLVNKRVAPSSVINRIKEISPKRIILLGSDAAITKEQEQIFINNFGRQKITRIEGKDRYETSAKINQTAGKNNFVLASGENYPDALSAGSFAESRNAGIVLSRQKALPASVKNLLTSAINKSPVIIGGESALSAGIAKELHEMGQNPGRIYGSNRYETAVALAKSSPSDILFIASGENFPDALAATSLAAQYKAPILLSGKESLPSSVENYLKTATPKEVILLGGEAALSKNIESQLRDLHSKKINHTAKEGGFIKITKDTPLYTDPAKTKISHTIPAGKFAFVYKIDGNYLYLKQDGKEGYTDTLDYTTMTTYGEKSYISGPFISQVYPEDIPMACESASALMGLKRKGYAEDITLPKFLEKLPRASRDPNLGFVGDPYKVTPNIYMTIHPKPLAEYAKTFGKVQDLSGADLSYLRMELLNGNPVVFWGTYQFRNPVYFNYWNGTKTARGIDNAHVVLLVGYDGTTGEYIVADPYNPDKPKENYEFRVKESTVEKIYNLQKYAMVVR